MLDVLLALFLELFELVVVLESGFFEVPGFHGEGGLEFLYFSAVEFFHPGKFSLESLIFDDEILVLVEKVVDFELEFGNDYFLATELVLQFDKFIFELDSNFPFVIEIVLILFPGLPELLALVFQHELDLTEILFIYIAIIYKL